MSKGIECAECATSDGKSSSEVIWKVEKSMLTTALSTLLFLIFVELVAYYGFFRTIPNFFPKYGYYILFLIVAIVSNAMALWHCRAYQHIFSCTTGMMVGMTIGMSAGFSIGMLVGATNGMFIGSAAGIIIGMLAGSYAGNCCGVMGIMEGMMAGLMGGLMGAMTSVMTINDRVIFMIPLLTISMLIILIGLMVMVYQEEIRKKPDVHRKIFTFLPFITVNFIILIAITFLMVYGPRSLLFS